MQRFHDRATSRLPPLLSVLRGMAANLRLDRVDITDARQHVQRERRLRRFEELVERSPQMRPAEREFDRVVLAIPCQPLAPGVAATCSTPRNSDRCAAGRMTLRSSAYT